MKVQEISRISKQALKVRSPAERDLFFENLLSAGREVLMALGMGVSNAAVFKLVPQEVPQAVGGAAGWVGGLGAFGGFAIPPVMGTFVRVSGTAGYASGFVVFIGLSVLSLGFVYLLKRTHLRRAKLTVASSMR